MKTKRLEYFSIMLVFCLLLTGCVCGPKPERLITPLPKLTTAIQGFVRWPPNDGSPLTNEELIVEVFEDKPELKELFNGTPIKVWHNDRYVIVLISSPKNDQAWLEDASWTPEVDRLWYQYNSPQPSEFTLIPLVP